MEASQDVTAEKHCCTKCGINFKDTNSLEMHITMHSFSEKCLTKAEMALRRKLLYQEVKKQQNEAALYHHDDKTAKVGRKPRRIYKPKCNPEKWKSYDLVKLMRNPCYPQQIKKENTKRLGLTKVRMEDCLRCDACSCIYLHPSDYYKHMRNFHQKYNTIIPRCRKKSPIRITKEEDDRADGSLQSSLGQERPISVNSRDDKQIREKIKIRWSEVISQRLLPERKPVPEQDVDMSLLLSNVEVSIKIEPPDVS